MAWKPSARASELIGVLIEAFADGDRWVKFTNPATARLTGCSLVWNGVAEFDPATMRGDYSMRIRLGRGWAKENGWSCWQDAAAEFNQEEVAA